VSAVLVEGLLAVAGLDLELIAGRGGLTRRLTGPRIQKPGLALAGYVQHVHTERLQVLGLTEISYLGTLSDAKRREGLEALFGVEPAGIVITRGLPVPDEAAAIA
jgi:HPr kinase/phosphorylase